MLCPKHVYITLINAIKHVFQPFISFVGRFLFRKVIFNAVRGPFKLYQKQGQPWGELKVRCFWGK